MGANGFLAAPFKPFELINYVNHVLNGNGEIPKSKVLIIEDSIPQTKIIKRAYEANGYEVFTTQNGDEALELFEEHRPDIIILDYFLKNITGDMLLPEFKKPQSRSVTIVITTDSDPQRALRVIKLGADGYVRKPFDPEYLVELSRKALREFSFIRVENLLEARSKALQESNKRFKKLFENIPEIVILREASGEIININDAGARQLEYEANAIIGQNVNSLVVSENNDDKYDFINEPFRLQTIFRCRNGQHIPVEINEIKMVYEDREVYLMVARDMLYRQKRGEEALKAQKLESLGVIAGGIAHDYNNLLTAIIGNLSMVKFQKGLDEKTIDFVDKAEKAAHRIKDLTQQLSTFSSGGKPVKIKTHVENVVPAAVRFSLHGSNVTSSINMQNNLHPVLIDEGQFRQVIHSLVINSSQAMPKGGQITVTVQNKEIDKDEHLTFSSKETVEIRISDEGEGIRSDHLTKIFDPFFTTKPKCSGLGLSSAYSIIKHHDGLLTVDSEYGKGTTVTILLPAIIEKEKSKENDQFEPTSSRGKVLVMDDEQDVRDVTKEMLMSFGLTVETVESGEEAIQTYKTALYSDDPFKLIIMDLTIPGGMDGKETLTEILKFDPKVKAIVSSGYSEAAIMSQYELYGFKGCIRKPFTVQELFATVF